MLDNVKQWVDLTYINDFNDFAPRVHDEFVNGVAGRAVNRDDNGEGDEASQKM